MPRVLACGSRTFQDENIIRWVLDGLDPRAVIEGAAPGADTIAGDWASHHPKTYRTHLQFPADWNKYGKAAGPIRNQQMIDEGKPTMVVAFVDKPLVESRGTNDMVQRSLKAGLPVYVVQKMNTENPQEDHG